jgi:hypothetical protein
MGFGGFFFYGDPQCGGQFTLAGSPKAQLIIYCLQHELWQKRFNNALGEISQQHEMCGAIFFG